MSQCDSAEVTPVPERVSTAASGCPTNLHDWCKLHVQALEGCAGASEAEALKTTFVKHALAIAERVVGVGLGPERSARRIIQRSENLIERLVKLTPGHSTEKFVDTRLDDVRKLLAGAAGNGRQVFPK